MWLVYGEDANKVPFEDSVLAYLQEHDGQGLTIGDAARDLGISTGAISLALLSLQAKGVLEPDSTSQGENP